MMESRFRQCVARITLLAGLALVSSCGGGSSNEPEAVAPPAGLTVQAQLKSSTYQFPVQWNNRYVTNDQNTLEFLDAPALTVGSIFVINGQAYRATSVAPSPPFLVGVERPSLPEVYESIVFNGEWDMSDLAEPRESAARSRETTQEDPPFSVVKATEGEFQGYRVVGTKEVPLGLKVQANVFAGTRFVMSNWDPLSGAGSLEMRVAFQADATLGVSSSPDSVTATELANDFCGAPSNTRFRTRLFTLERTLPFLTLVGPVWLSVPVCASMGGKIDLRGDIARLTSSAEYRLDAKGGVVSLLRVRGGIDGELPRKAATFDTPLALSQGASLTANGELRLEASLVVNASGLVHVTAQAQSAVYANIDMKAVDQAKVQSIDSAIQSNLLCLQGEVGYLLRVSAYVDAAFVNPWQVPIGLAESWPLRQEAVGPGCYLVPSIMTNRLDLVPMTPGEEVALRAFGTNPAQAVAPLPPQISQWKSLDPQVARVDSNGKVTAISVGRTEVVLTNLLNDMTAKVAIVVQGPAVVVSICDAPVGSATAAEIRCFLDQDRTTWDYRAAIVGVPSTFQYSQTSYWPSRQPKATLLVNVNAGVPATILKEAFNANMQLVEKGEVRQVPGGTMRFNELRIYHPNGVIWSQQVTTCELTATQQFASRQVTLTNDDHSFGGYSHGAIAPNDCPSIASVDAINDIDYRASILYRNLLSGGN